MRPNCSSLPIVRSLRRPFCAASVALLLAAGMSAAAFAAPAFPLKASSDQRYLVDQNDVPFPILGRSSWAIASLSDEDRQLYVEDCVARGFNAVEFWLVSRDTRANHVPYDAAGNAPFLRRLNGSPWDGTMNYQDVRTEAPDFTTPNEAYWKRMDGLLAYLQAKGILCFVFPAYVGYGGPSETVQGWMHEVAANGPERMRQYATWLAQRYQHQPNLVWMLGGDTNDFSPVEAAAETALIEALTQLTPNLFRSAEWESETTGPDHPQFGPAITLNGVYSFTGYTAALGRRAYAHQPKMPAYLLEEPYDEEGLDGNRVNPWALQPVRQFEWTGWLSTIGGYIAGNGYVWPFVAPAWKLHLDSAGARDLARLNAFIRSIRWHELVPSDLAGMRTLITEGASEPRSPDYVASAATRDGTLLVAYLPPAHRGKLQVDLETFSAPVRVRWMDPSTGAFTAGESPLPNQGKHHLTPPWKNAAGDTDWVLVMDTGSAAPSRP